MPFAWKPLPGQVALIEMTHGGNDCLTGVVIDGDGGPVVVDLGASPRPDLGGLDQREVIASFFAPDALYRLTATLSPHGTGSPDSIIDLRVLEIERVQRRTAPRVRLALPLVMSNFDDPSSDDAGAFASVVGETLDIGEGGCRAVMPKPFPHGCDPTVTLHLPDGASIVALAAVLQATTAGDGRYEYRLVFLELDDADRLRLSELVAEPSANATA